MAEPPAAAAPKRGSGRRTLLLIALVGLAPVVASTVVYFFFPRPAATNYGELLQVAPAPEITGTRLDTTPFRLSELQGKWLLVMRAPGSCDERCRRELYATRQARTIQGREQDRIVRVWLVSDGAAPSSEVLAEHPGLVVARVDGATTARLPGGGEAIYLIDPRGNMVLRYPPEPDIKALAKDLKRLLAASVIG